MLRSCGFAWAVALALLCPLAVVDATAQTGTSSSTTSTTPRASAPSPYTTTEDLRDVRPFQAWLTDATWTSGVDVEPVAEFANLDDASGIFAGAQGAFWLSEDFEVGGRWGFLSIDPENFDSESGISDLALYGRYRLGLAIDDTETAVGLVTTLPIGSEDVGQSNFDLQAFGALRYTTADGIAVLGQMGIDSQEVGDDRELGILLGGGTIIPVTEELAAIAELQLTTAIDYAAISAGVDYELPPGGHLRAALLLGIDDAAPDAELRLGFAIPVY